MENIFPTNEMTNKDLRNEDKFVVENYSEDEPQNLSPSQLLNNDLKSWIFDNLIVSKIDSTGTFKSGNDTFKGVSDINNSDKNSIIEGKADFYNVRNLVNTEIEEVLSGSFVPFMEQELNNPEINNTSNNIATLLTGLPQMAILNGSGQAGNIHVFCPENESCFLKPSDILSMPSKMATDAAFQLFPINFPFMDYQYSPSPMLTQFPLEMLHSPIMPPKFKTEQHMQFDPKSTWFLDGKVFLKDEFSKKYDQELTNSNLNIREPTEQIVDCWSDDRLNAKKHAKCSSRKKISKEKTRNRKPSPWKLFNRSKSKVKMRDFSYYEKDGAPRRTLSCTIEDGNISKMEDEYYPIPIKLSKYFRSLPSCGSHDVKFGNRLNGVRKIDDSTSWESHKNSLEFDHISNKWKKIYQKRPNLKFPITNLSQMKFKFPHFHDMTSNSETSSISQSDFSQKLKEKYFKRRSSCYPRENKSYEHHKYSIPNQRCKIKKSGHYQNRKNKQNTLKNCFRLKVQGSRAYLEPLKKASRNDINCKQILQMLSSPEELAESYFGVESGPFTGSHEPSNEEYLFKELVKIPDEFLKKSDNLSKQINLVDNHVKHLEKLLKCQYSSEHTDHLSLSKLDMNSSSLDNKTSKTLDLNNNITPTMSQVKIVSSDIPSVLKKSGESGSTAHDKNVSFQDFQTFFEKYFDKLQRICTTTEHTKEICTLILDTVCKVNLKRPNMSCFDEESFKNELMGFDSEMILPAKNMQLNNHSISNLQSDLNFDIFPENLVLGNEFKSHMMAGSRPITFKENNFVKLSHNNNAPLQIQRKHKHSTVKENIPRSCLLKKIKNDNFKEPGKWIYLPDFGKYPGLLGNRKHSNECAQDSFPFTTTLKSKNGSESLHKKNDSQINEQLNRNNKLKNSTINKCFLKNNQYIFPNKIVHPISDALDSDDSEIKDTIFENNNIFEISMNNHNKQNKKVDKNLNMLYSQNSNEHHKLIDTHKDPRNPAKHATSDLPNIDVESQNTSDDINSDWNINDFPDINLTSAKMEYIEKKREDIGIHSCHDDKDLHFHCSDKRLKVGSYLNNVEESLSSTTSNECSALNSGSVTSFENIDSIRSSMYNCETLAFYSRLVTSFPNKQTSSKKEDYLNKSTKLLGNHCTSDENVSINLDFNDKNIELINQLDATILEITEKFANAFRDNDDINCKSEHLCNESNVLSSTHIDLKEKQNYLIVNSSTSDSITCDNQCLYNHTTWEFKSDALKVDKNIDQQNLDVVKSASQELRMIMANHESHQSIEIACNAEHLINKGLFKRVPNFLHNESIILNEESKLAVVPNFPSSEVDEIDACIRDAIDYILDHISVPKCQGHVEPVGENILPSLLDDLNSYKESQEIKSSMSNCDLFKISKKCLNNSVLFGDFINDKNATINFSKVIVRKNAYEDNTIISSDVEENSIYRNSVSDPYINKFVVFHSKLHKTESFPTSAILSNNIGQLKDDLEFKNKVIGDSDKIFCNEMISNSAMENVSWEYKENKFDLFLNPVCEQSEIKFGSAVSLSSQNFHQMEAVKVSQNKSLYSVNTGNSSNRQLDYSESSYDHLHEEKFVNKVGPNIGTIYKWKSLYDNKRDNEVNGIQHSKDIDEEIMVNRIIWDRTTKQKFENKFPSDFHDSKINLIPKLHIHFTPKELNDQKKKTPAMVDMGEWSSRNEKSLILNDSCLFSSHIKSNHRNTGSILNSKIHEFGESLNEQVDETKEETVRGGRIECYDLLKLNLLAQNFITSKCRPNICSNKKKMKPRNVHFTNTHHKTSFIRKQSISKITHRGIGLKSELFAKFQNYLNFSKEHGIKLNVKDDDLKLPSECFPLKNDTQKNVNFKIHSNKLCPSMGRSDIHMSKIENDGHYVKSFSDVTNNIRLVSDVIVSQNKHSNKKMDFDTNSQKSPKGYLKVINKEFGSTTKEKTCAALHEKILDMEKEIMLYNSRICEMKRRIGMKNQTKREAVEFYEHNKIHRHYANLLKIFKRKEYGAKIRCSMLRSTRNLKMRNKNDFNENHDDNKPHKLKVQSCVAKLNKCKKKGRVYVSSNKSDEELTFDYLNTFGNKSVQLLNSFLSKILNHNSSINNLPYKESKKYRNKSSYLDRDYGEQHHQKIKKFVVTYPSNKVQREAPLKTSHPCRKLNVVFKNTKVSILERNLKSPISAASSYKVVSKPKSKCKHSGTIEPCRSVWVRTEFPYKKPEPEFNNDFT